MARVGHLDNYDFPAMAVAAAEEGLSRDMEVFLHVNVEEGDDGMIKATVKFQLQECTQDGTDRICER